jgi:hypothetical protein
MSDVMVWIAKAVVEIIVGIMQGIWGRPGPETQEVLQNEKTPGAGSDDELLAACGVQRPHPGSAN